MKKSLAALLVLFSTNVWAATQLTCNIAEHDNLSGSGVEKAYTITAPLTDNWVILDNLESQNLDLTFSVSTWLLSDAHQVVLIGISDNKTGDKSAINGYSYAQTSYNTNAGALSIACSAQ